MKIILISLGILYSSVLFSQTGTYVSYGYVGGNRVSRVIVYQQNNNARLSENSNQQDSTGIIQPVETAKVFSETFEKSNISIYPNPTKGVLAVDVKSSNEVNNIRLQLYDLQGKQIYNEDNFKGKSEINFVNSPPGTYALKIIIEGKELVWTVIKQ